jgi:GABA(A) receptor-associated protein
MSIKNIPYKTKFSLEKRREESAKICQKYADRIPVIVTPSGKSVGDHPINKEKFLVPGDLTVSQFQYVIRKRIQLSAEEAMWIFVVDKDGREVIPPTATSMAALYKEHVEDTKNSKEYDGFLYILYSGENTFGNL